MTDRGHEWVCVECGMGVSSALPAPEFKLCVHCLAMPGWYKDPLLLELLDPSGQTKPRFRNAV